MSDATAPRAYPEHEKLHAVVNQSRVCGEFIDWLRHTKGLHLCAQHEHSIDCRDADMLLGCGLQNGDYMPTHLSLQELLAEFFGIDRDKIEEEKRAMLAELRGDSSLR